MIKIIQTGDVHLGAPLRWLETKGEEQRAQLIRTFTKIIDQTISKKADVLVIAGDLFDSYLPSEALKAHVKSELSRLSAANIYTVILPGNHDRLETGSVYSDNNFSANIRGHIFRSGAAEVYKIPELELSIFAKGVIKQFSRDSQLAEINPINTDPNRSKYNICILHGSLVQNNDPNYPILPEEINQSNYDYIALGDWHSVRQVNSKCWYAGSPEVLATDQKESGFILEIQLNGNVEVKQYKIAERIIETLEINLNALDEGNETESIITQIKNSAEKNKILLVEIKGHRRLGFNLNFEQIEKDLNSLFFYLSVVDATKLKFTEQSLKAFPEESVTGRYISILRREMENEKDAEKLKLIEEALQEGVAMLNENN